MATFDIYGHLIEPAIKALQADPRLSALNKIYYDRTDDRQPPRETMPCMNIFFDPRVEDANRGSGSYSVQTRRMYVRIGFAVWCYSSKSEADLDEQLFGISGDVLDWFREHTEFDQTRGIFVRADVPIEIAIDYQGGENAFVGSQKISVSFELYGGSGK